MSWTRVRHFRVLRIGLVEQGRKKHWELKHENQGWVDNEGEPTHQARDMQDGNGRGLVGYVIRKGWLDKESRKVADGDENKWGKSCSEYLRWS